MSEKINELLQDEAFAEAVVNAENEEAVKALFAGKGEEISDTELQGLGQAFANVAAEQNNDGDELDEDDLENVSGGLNGLTTIAKILPNVLTDYIKRLNGRPDAGIILPTVNWWNSAVQKQHKKADTI